MNELEEIKGELAEVRAQLTLVTAMLKEALEPSETWMTVRQAAEFMGVSEATIRRHVERKIIESKRLSNKPKGDIRIRKSSLIAPNKERRRGRRSSGVRII